MIFLSIRNKMIHKPLSIKVISICFYLLYHVINNDLYITLWKDKIIILQQSPYLSHIN